MDAAVYTPEVVSRLREDWLATLVTERTGETTFLSRATGRDFRRWGASVMSQALLCAAQTAHSKSPLSLQADFLRPGTWLEDLTLEVETLRNGRRLKSRLVHAIQKGKPIVTCTVNFGDAPGHLDHGDAAPEASPPEGIEDWWDRLNREIPSKTRSKRTFWDLRSEGSEAQTRPAGQPPQRRTWAKPRAALPDDPLVHAAAILTVSDTGLTSTVMLGYENARPTSVDHAIWFHEAPRFDDWMLYASRSPVGRGGRALIEAAFYAGDGRRVASVAQECMLPV